MNYKKKQPRLQCSLSYLGKEPWLRLVTWLLQWFCLKAGVVRILCFLTGPPRWLMAAKNENISWLLNFRVRVLLKTQPDEESVITESHITSCNQSSFSRQERTLGRRLYNNQISQTFPLCATSIRKRDAAGMKWEWLWSLWDLFVICFCSSFRTWRCTTFNDIPITFLFFVCLLLLLLFFFH